MVTCAGRGEPVTSRSHNRMGTKAETLKTLRDAGFRVPRTFHFDLAAWRSSPEAMVGRILSEFPVGGSFAVRSSCRREDSGGASMAGAFHSVLDVAPEAVALTGAVSRVVESYGDEADPSDQVLIQPMVGDIVMSGVVMTRVLEDGSPYYSVNYDDESGKTDTVTGGGVISKTVFVFRNFRNSDFDSPRLLNLLRLVRQIESFFGSDCLDIEFAMTSQLEYHIFQVRPIVATAGWNHDLDGVVTDKISYVEDYLQSINAKRPDLFGKRTILGVMPDWNPAEIIGLTPRPLASSLYRHIVTQSVWREARASMGYHGMPPEELMLLIAARPYIDVRASFNSFLPEGVDHEIAHLLVDSWIDRLDRNPNLHDKVEFEIVPTVHDFSFDRDFKERYPDILSETQFESYKASLLELTRKLVSIGPDSSLGRALSAVASLEKRQLSRTPPPLGNANAILARIRDLLEECKREGTLPFSVIARHAFVAESFLRSAIGRGAWSSERYQQFKSSIRTVSGEFSRDHSRVLDGELDPGRFLARYGHLRPGTYDILTPTYRDDRARILAGHPCRDTSHTAAPNFLLESGERDRFSVLLSELGMEHVPPEDLLEYARRAIAGREDSKFIFTRSLSDAIEAVAQWGALHSFGREELSWLSIYDILGGLVNPVLNDPREHYLPLVDQGRRSSDAGKHIKLGFLIRSARDVFIVPQHRSTPNFVTRAKVTAPVARLGDCASGVGPEGAIVCIENADPGYDWLFSRGIAGLVTKYGGTNSHMTIRCSEYGVPAAIGCGESLFEKIASSRMCELDADTKILRGIDP